jgi:hypothetical protein
MPTPGIEAIVSFGGLEYTLGGVLGTLTHVRGWGYPTSYIVCELNNPHTEIINEFMNYGTVTVKYGKDQEFLGPIPMEIISVQNQSNFSNVKVKVIAVEPGFVRMTEKDKIKSFPNQTISGAAAQMASDAGLRTIGIKQTSGNFTYIQTNMNDLRFLTKYLVPLATDSAKSAPYLFTIDNGIMHLRPPNLTQEPKFRFIVDPSNETVVKRFDVKNKGMESDFTYGNEYLTYGYDFKEKGVIQHTDFISSVNGSLLNQNTYDSNFLRCDVLPYEEPWMIKAYNRNNVARAQFIVGAEAILVGEVEYLFDQVYQFTQQAFGGEPTEYSGRYYVYSMITQLKTRFFVSQFNLISNAFLKSEKTPSPRQSTPSNRVRGSSGGLARR